MIAQFDILQTVPGTAIISKTKCKTLKNLSDDAFDEGGKIDVIKFNAKACKDKTSGI